MAVLLPSFWIGQPLSAQLPCLKCHGMKTFSARDDRTLKVQSLHVDSVSFKTSAHGKLACRDCHADITKYPHVKRLARVSCNQQCHATDKQGRPFTHQVQVAQLAASAHGVKGKKFPADMPTCAGCHAANVHAIQKVANWTTSQRMDLCVRCHDNATLMKRHDVNVSAVSSYRRSFHYKAIRFGEKGTAVCEDCHGTHFILSKDSAGSTVAAANLTRTCGRDACHKGAGQTFAVSGANHLDLRIEDEPILFAEEKFFFALTGGTMVMLLIGIVLDVQRKFGWLVLAGRARNRVCALRAQGVSQLRRAWRVLRYVLIG